MTVITLFLIASLFDSGLGLEQSPGRLKYALIRGADLYLQLSESAEPKRVTFDGGRYSLPVWSPDGTRVAVIRRKGEPVSTALLILSQTGRVEREISLPPSQMRFVELLDWTVEGKIVAAGSVNPSTVEHVVIDSRAGTVGGGYLTDGWGLAFSPDGSHVAYHAYLPHFTEEAGRRPQLCIDAECPFDGPARGYPDHSRHWEFRSTPVWNTSGTMVADVAEDVGAHTRHLIIRPLRGTPTTYMLPETLDSPRVLLCWHEEILYVSGGDRVWTWAPGAATLSPDGKGGFGEVWAEAQKTKLQLKQALRAQGTPDGEIWCDSCPLRFLPQRNGID